MSKMVFSRVKVPLILAVLGVVRQIKLKRKKGDKNPDLLEIKLFTRYVHCPQSTLLWFNQKLETYSNN